MINTVAERYDPSHRLMAENDWGRYPFVAAVMAPGVHSLPHRPHAWVRTRTWPGAGSGSPTSPEGDILGNGAVLDQRLFIERPASFTRIGLEGMKRIP